MCFSQSKQNELWVVILEKVWAKLHGSYESIIGGFEHDTLRDLTGAPAYMFSLADEDAWDKIIDADKRHYMMCASTHSGEKHDKN